MLRSLSLPPPAFLMPITTASRRALAGGTNPHLTHGMVGVACLKVEEYSEFLICMCVCEMPRGLGWVVSFVSKEAWRWWGGCLRKRKKEEEGLGWVLWWWAGDLPGR